MRISGHIPVKRFFPEMAGILLILQIITVSISFSQVIINEVCASNSSIFKDTDGEFGDWIELLNTDSVPVNLENYCLSDDRDNLAKWCFPEYLLSPGDHFIVFATGKDVTSFPQYWHTIIDMGDTWKYILPDENTDPDWRNTGFDDSSWQSGPGGIGYEDGDDATVIPATVSVFMRRRFEIEDLSRVSHCVLHIDYDDAFVAYLNGREVARSGIYGNPPAFDRTASTGREATIYTGGEPGRYDVLNPSGLLLQGENILAIQVHNISQNSSDLSAIPFLSLQTSQKPPDPPTEILNLSGTYFHSNFKLDADGDSLYIKNPEGILTDSLHLPTMGTDHAYGRKENEHNEWVVFEIPTPGGPNNTSYFSGYVESEPVFLTQGGRFAEPFSLTITTTDPGDSIYYTLDGSEPDQYSFRYHNAIRISSDTIIRARIIRDGFVPGRIVTNTYFKGSDNHLPVVCITTDPDNLWDHYTGIYAFGPDAQDDFPYFDANFWQDWEMPAHVEHYNENGDPAFSIDAGIKIYGGWTRGLPQKSMTVFARGIHGAKKIDYRLFNNRSENEFESFVIRNSGNDWFGEEWETGTMFRDILMTRLTRNMDIEYMASTQSIVYINGKYWGIHNIREKISEHFIASNKGADPDKIDLLESNQIVLRGDDDHYANLISFLNSNNIRLEENYSFVKSQIDIQNFINYQVAQIYYDNRDWPGNNIKYWRPATPKGKWRWIIYDTDFGFGLWNPNDYNRNTLLFATESNGPHHPNPPWSTYLLRTLLLNQEFRQMFINSFADQINTSFISDSVIYLINMLKDNIDEEMYNHVERWGGSYQNWTYQTTELKNFARLRPGTMQNYIKNTFGLESSQELTIDVSDESVGSVKLNTIFITDFPWKGIYFEGNPVEMIAISKPGYRFTGWTGDFVSDDPQINIDLTTGMTIVANFEPDLENKRNPVLINEICYNQDPEADCEDWIELFNNSNTFVDISGWILKDSDDSHSYEIKSGILLSPHSYYVICRNRNAFEKIYPGVDNYDGDFNYGFSSNGEVIRLYNSDGELVDSVRYGVTSPWPLIPGNSGHTLALHDPDSDNVLPESWDLSIYQLGTPGGNNSFALNINQKSIKIQKDVLFQNSPNPFAFETRIVFYSVRTQPVRVSVYDLYGRLIEDIAHCDLEAGYHEFNWVPVTRDEGMLILRLETPRKIHTRKMIISR